MTTERGTVTTGWPRTAQRGDAWRAASWRTPGHRLPAALAFLAVILAVLTTNFVGSAIAERWEQQEQRTQYVPVTVSATPSALGERLVDVRGAAAPFGDLLLRVPARHVAPGRDVTLLVHREDPSLYVLPVDRADPLRPAAQAGATALLALVSALLAAAVVRSRRVDVTPVRRVAARTPEPVPPPPVTPWRYERVLRVVPPLMFAVIGVFHLTSAERPPPLDLVTEQQKVRLDDTGTPVVGAVPRGPVEDRVVFRPLTGAERATGAGEGDELAVTTALRPYGPPPDVEAMRQVHGVGFAALGLFGLGFALAWPYRVRRALASPPALYDVVGWSRRRLGAEWLYVAPAGATRPDQITMIPLARGVVPPGAFAGPVYVHGRLRPRSVAIVRDPLSGAAFWPGSPCASLLPSVGTGHGPAVPRPPYDPGA